MLTYDQSPYASDQRGNHRGVVFDRSYRTHDGRTADSTGAFLVGELERLDQMMHLPLASVTWSRDIDLRPDVTIADEVSSFTTSTYGSPGGAGGGAGIGRGKAWIGIDTTQIAGISVDLAKIPHPLRPWALEVKYTILELESAAKLGRPIDQQKLEGLQLKHQMDIDEQAYYGDLTTGDTGLVNCSIVTTITNLPAGAGGLSWAQKTPAEILNDVNYALSMVWGNSAWAVMPSRILIPPPQYGAISTQPVTTAGSQSILRYLMDNNLLAQAGVGGKLEILPSKWCVGAGAGGTIGIAAGFDRMVVYTKQSDKIRFPMTLLQRTPVQYDGIYHKFTMFCRLGVVETVYPETVGYFDKL